MCSVDTLDFFPYHRFLILKSVFHINGGEQVGKIDLKAKSNFSCSDLLEEQKGGQEGRLRLVQFKEQRH